MNTTGLGDVYPANLEKSESCPTGVAVAIYRVLVRRTAVVLLLLLSYAGVYVQVVEAWDKSTCMIYMCV